MFSSQLIFAALVSNMILSRKRIGRISKKYQEAKEKAEFKSKYNSESVCDTKKDMETPLAKTKTKPKQNILLKG